MVTADASPQLDQLSIDAVVDRLLDAEARVLPALRRAEGELARAAALLAGAVVAVAASGRTPFTLAGAIEARSAGAPVIAVVNAERSPLAAVAQLAVELIVGEEVLRGSTRLSAGTAQKVALNALTTAAMAAAGRTHGDLMIDVSPANAKLRDRLTCIVAEIVGCPLAEADAAVQACGGSGRAAVLHLLRGLSPADAARQAAAHRSLRAALNG